ncbi:MAG: lytic transglycosylase domain-containing protein [Treponema sp.]|nr:lytic transglycosylase domain-containing protein [Treponema sp.]MCL2236896.1 lytic transglycosylase domain-containing protein [Treponema sp.]
MKLHSIILFVVFTFVFPFLACVTPQRAQVDHFFYQGLLSESNEEKIEYFENALASDNEFIRRAAADQLAMMMAGNVELSDKTIERMKREAYGWWATALNVTSREHALSFFLSIESNSDSFNMARLYALRECEKKGIEFSPGEKAAIEAHHAVFQTRYADALAAFKGFQANNAWPAEMPPIFLEYPNLINDLGRTLLFAPANREGVTLLNRWESNLSDQEDDIRFRIVFYAARNARRASLNAQAITLFEKALTLAPDYEQQDACIWYILDAVMTGSSSDFIERLRRHVPNWHNGNSYYALMERFLVKLVTGSEWRNVINTFDVLKDSNSSSKGGFAWLIARFIEERMLNAEDRRLAARAIGAETATAQAYYQIAYNAGENLLMPSLYYRMKSGVALGLPLLVLPEEDTVPDAESAPSNALAFLLGFFENNAAGFATPFIRAMERSLSPDELRAVSQALSNAGMHPLSMRLITLYLYREGFVKERRDLELMYPRPFREIIEENAERFDITPYMLYGLIRTESAFQTAVVSHAGAGGLAQLMPATARAQAIRIRDAGGPNFFGPDDEIDRSDPYANVYIGSYYLNYQRGSFGDMVLAIMAYNGGHFRVRRWRAASTLPIDLLVETVPIYETRDYGRRVPAIGQIYKELYYND